MKDLYYYIYFAHYCLLRKANFASPSNYDVCLTMSGVILSISMLFWGGLGLYFEDFVASKWGEISFVTSTLCIAYANYAYFGTKDNARNALSKFASSNENHAALFGMLVFFGSLFLTIAALSTRYSWN